MIFNRIRSMNFVALLLLFHCCSTRSHVFPTCCDYDLSTGVGYLNFSDCDIQYNASLFSSWFRYPIEYHPISCPVHSIVRRLDFKIEDDVGVISLAADNKTKYSIRNYCLDFSEGELFARVCDLGQELTLSWPQKYCSVVSATILILTHAAYLVNRPVSNDQQNDPYLICHSISLAAAFVCLAKMKLFHASSRGWDCMVIGYLLQYFSLVAFFWMNAIYINTYITISVRQFRSNTRAQEIVRWNVFKKFAVYSWCVPLLITLSTCSLQFANVIADPFVKPDIGVKSCFFHSQTASWIYFYGPIGIIIFVNTILFVLTASIIYKQYKVSKLFWRRDKSTENRWCMKAVILKLFIYTGSLTWGSEVVNFVVLKNSSSPESQRELVGLIDVFFHFLHAFSVFYFLVYQNGVHKSLSCYPKAHKFIDRIRSTMSMQYEEDSTVTPSHDVSTII